ncbi:MAG: 4-(cytidine 5'-diphospho)-2-C-methyl-D-erythritol kinase [Alphaproteobacteria bacterium]|nr:4-(cytidine 5'-diphospho)-2-C-methyl-D-erythritol kinase [Alphaproteobacteria bacterium]
MTLIREFAPAKINLYLHVTGRKDNGYHELDSLVAFASIGDEIALRPKKGFLFETTGRYADALSKDEQGNENIAVKAARALAASVGKDFAAHIVLVKNLPVASGIGGGSSDAAATLRALAKHWGLFSEDPRLAAAAARHGQDITVCLSTNPVYMIADGIEPAPPLPKASIVLVNPGAPLSTPDVFKAFRESGAPFSPPRKLEKAPQTLDEMIAALKERSNDLYEPAKSVLPCVAEVMASLEASPSCLLARMSGSGATCFGLYPDETAAKSVASQIRAVRPHWWVETGTLNG